ncbi:hypothetical protein NKH48_17610 [Mesorhizobium sp. M1233]|uniref:hypothetical protein n=1 Tax=Mesorhizobium sp. M1233 TaxID=2957072 RepID=UPI0033382492
MRKGPTAIKLASDGQSAICTHVLVLRAVDLCARNGNGDAAVLGPDEYLTVDASVKVRGKRTEESKANLKKLANDLADITDGTVQVEGRDGKLSDGDAILRTNMPFDLPHAGSNLLDFNNVSDQLQEVYSRFVRDGKIVP